MNNFRLLSERNRTDTSDDCARFDYFGEDTEPYYIRVVGIFVGVMLLGCGIKMV